MKGCSCCSSSRKVRRGLWSPDEDACLQRFIQANGIKCWSHIPLEDGLERCGKSCRLRWINYLRPDLKRGNFSLEEQKVIINLHSQFGNRWSFIAKQLPGRTDNEIKNFWTGYVKGISRIQNISKVLNVKKISNLDTATHRQESQSQSEGTARSSSSYISRSEKITGNTRTPLFLTWWPDSDPIPKHDNYAAAQSQHHHLSISHDDADRSSSDASSPCTLEFANWSNSIMEDMDWNELWDQLCDENFA